MLLCFYQAKIYLFSPLSVYVKSCKNVKMKIKILELFLFLVTQIKSRLTQKRLVLRKHLNNLTSQIVGKIKAIMSFRLIN